MARKNESLEPIEDVSELESDDDLGIDDGLDFGVDDNDFGGSDFGVGLSPAMDRHNELLKSLTDFDDFLKRAVSGWLGLVWDSNESRYIQKNEPLMNLKGANWCITLLEKYVRKNNIITTIRLEDYNYMLEDAIDIINYNLGVKAEEFEITDNGNILRIADEVLHCIMLVLMGAGEGRYNKLLTETTQRNENVSVNPAGQMQYGMPVQNVPKKRGFIGRVLSKFGM